MDALWSAATIKIVGSGIDDADFADRLSRQIGDHDVQTTSVSTSEGGKSTSVSMRTERVLPPDAIRWRIRNRSWMTRPTSELASVVSGLMPGRQPTTGVARATSSGAHGPTASRGSSGALERLPTAAHLVIDNRKAS